MKRRGNNSSTVTKSGKKAPRKSNKRNKSLSEEEMEDLCGQLEVVMRNLHETRNIHAAREVTLSWF